jgi:hypothetical protein
MNRTKLSSRPWLARSNDTRVLIAGVAAFLALVAYLAVAFATARSSPAVAASVGAKAQMVGPWRARTSKLVRVPRTVGGGIGVRVTPLTRGLYGVEIQQLALTPALRRGFTLSFWLRGRGPSRLLVQINTGALEPPIRYLLNTTVVARRRWHRFSYHGRLEGRTGLGLFVGQTTRRVAGRWFELRDLSVRASRR